MADLGTVWQGAAGLQPPPPPPPPPPPSILEFKNADFVNTIMSKVLRDLPFSQKRPLKSDDELVS